jgi:hypothetical protein
VTTKLGFGTNRVVNGNVIEFWSDSDEQGDDAMAFRVHLVRESE